MVTPFLNLPKNSICLYSIRKKTSDPDKSITLLHFKLYILISSISFVPMVIYTLIDTVYLLKVEVILVCISEIQKIRFCCFPSFPLAFFPSFFPPPFHCCCGGGGGGGYVWILQTGMQVENSKILGRDFSVFLVIDKYYQK